MWETLRRLKTRVEHLELYRDEMRWIFSKRASLWGQSGEMRVVIAGILQEVPQRDWGEIQRDSQTEGSLCLNSSHGICLFLRSRTSSVWQGGAGVALKCTADCREM